jgi:hypothetical protein
MTLLKDTLGILNVLERGEVHYHDCPVSPPVIYTFL